MKLSILYTLLAIALTSQQPADNTVVDPPGKTIKVLLLNGKNGKPIGSELLIVLFGSQIRIIPRTNSGGEIVIPIQSPDVAAYPSLYVDCRFKKQSPEGKSIFYSVDQILKKGVVGGNVCSKQQSNPLPGALILYVRPMTSWEKIKLAD